MKFGSAKPITTASGLTRHSVCNHLLLWDKENQMYVCPLCNVDRAAELIPNAAELNAFVNNEIWT